MSSLLSKKKIVIDGKQYNLKKLLAEGSNGYVYTTTLPSSAKREKGSFSLESLSLESLSLDTAPKAKGAVKVMICMDENSMRHSVREIEVMTAVEHGNVCSLIDSLVVADPRGTPNNDISPHPFVVIVCPLYDHGDLESFVTEHGALPLSETLMIFKGVCHGVKALHANGFRHNDIKPLNILLKSSEGGENADDLPVPALTDFGSCGPLVAHCATRKEALAAVDFHSTATTPPYRAPELWDVFTGTVLDAPSDCFSLGCTLYFMLFGKQCFDYNVGKVAFPGGTSYRAFSSELCLSLCLSDARDRMTLEQCLTAIEERDVGTVFRERIRKEYTVELKREDGKYNKSSINSSESKDAGLSSFADFAGAFGEELRGDRVASTGSDGAEWGCFQGVGDDEGAGDELGGDALPPTLPPPPVVVEVLPSRMKAAVTQMRPRGWGLNGRKLVMKTVWCSLTPQTLALHKSALDSSKTHLEIEFRSTEVLDVSLGYVVGEGGEGDGAVEAGGKKGDVCFVLSYSESGPAEGGGQVELFANDLAEFEKWSKAITRNWLLVQSTTGATPPSSP